MISARSARALLERELELMPRTACSIPTWLARYSAKEFHIAAVSGQPGGTRHPRVFPATVSPRPTSWLKPEAPHAGRWRPQSVVRTRCNAHTVFPRVRRNADTKRRPGNWTPGSTPKPVRDLRSGRQPTRYQWTPATSPLESGCARPRSYNDVRSDFRHHQMMLPA